MAAEIGFVQQCLFCGSYSVWAVDALDPAEVSLRAAVQGQKVLQKDVHAAQEELLQEAQRRFLREAEADERYALLPCSTCIEILDGKLFAAWLDDRANCERPTPLCPHLAVTFEEGEAPPAYVRKAGKWTLAQGVGPKDLEVKLPFQLPAGQFKMLLPPLTAALRPPCWQPAKGGKTEPEPPEVWQERQALLERFLALVGLEVAVSTSKATARLRAPPIGQVLPSMATMRSAAEAEAAKRYKKAPGAPCPGARYVRVPLLAEAQVIFPLVESELEDLQFGASFSSDYDKSSVDVASASVAPGLGSYPPSIGAKNLAEVMEPKCDANLNSWQFKSCQLLSRQAFGHWKVEILVNALSAMKAPVDLVCVRCPADVNHRAGYSPKHNRIWMCANRFWNPFEFRRVLVHELTHAFDFARAKVDTGSCVHMACTEIRAWNLSGECDLWPNTFRFLGEDMINRKQRCVREGALASLLENERCQDSYVAHAALQEAWGPCWKDYWPFTTKPDLDTRYRQSPMLR
ncbi:unnamed protein product [Effrenium voratum]|uniref:Mitochondrial inner membrane protease ATP23 n=1 Tax=Effrenium voratum TaxID=2562239 RepID=A0AA36N586_9DINO|nr:unnamed protein product [Effrenium voratum]